jgi:SAM-dependent methyltransferase
MTTEGSKQRLRYFPEVYNVADEKSARQIILTDDGEGADTTTRWAAETPYLLELFQNTLNLRADSLVLDYGCGIGRLSKAIIDASGCSVIGLDASASMRKLALDYVGSDRFTTVSPVQFDTLVAAGLRVHAAIAVWVLQHCFSPGDDVARIRRSLVPAGSLWVMSMSERAVPAVREGMEVREGFCWVSDGIDVAALLRAEFDVVAAGEPDRSRVPNAHAFWMTLRSRESDPR